MNNSKMKKTEIKQTISQVKRSCNIKTHMSDVKTQQAKA